MKTPSRRDFVRFGGLAAAAGLGLPQSVLALADRKAPSTADEALAVLLEGNKRFVKGELLHPGRKPDDFRPLADGQNPFAAIVGCADSRVSPELIFDQGVGDLFVVRIAGNVITGTGASVKGSIEYAVAELGVKLILVLGHSGCGAIKAAIKHIDDKDKIPGSIGDLVETIKPAVAEIRGKPGDKLENAIRANIKRGVERLSGLEPILAEPVKKGKIKVIGASYDLREGKVVVLGD